MGWAGACEGVASGLGGGAGPVGVWACAVQGGTGLQAVPSCVRGMGCLADLRSLGAFRVRKVVLI